MLTERICCRPWLQSRIIFAFFCMTVKPSPINSRGFAEPTDTGNTGVDVLRHPEWVPHNMTLCCCIGHAFSVHVIIVHCPYSAGSANLRILKGDRLAVLLGDECLAVLLTGERLAVNVTWSWGRSIPSLYLPLSAS